MKYAHLLIVLLVALSLPQTSHAQKSKHPKRLKYLSVGTNAGVMMALKMNNKDATRNYFNGFGSTLLDFGGELSMTLSNAKGWGICIGFDYRTFSIETDKIQIVRDTGLTIGPSRYPRYIDSTLPGISYDFRRFSYLSYSVFGCYSHKIKGKFDLISKAGFLVRYASIVESNFDYKPTNYHNHSDFKTVVSSSLHAILGFGCSYEASNRLNLTCSAGGLISLNPVDIQTRHSSTMLFLNVGANWRLETFRGTRI